MHKSLDEFEIRPDATTGFMATDRVTVEKTVSSSFLERFDWIHFILAGNDDIHKSLNEFKLGEIGPWTTELVDYGVGCP